MTEGFANEMRRHEIAELLKLEEKPDGAFPPRRVEHCEMLPSSCVFCHHELPWNSFAFPAVLGTLIGILYLTLCIQTPNIM